MTYLLSLEDSFSDRQLWHCFGNKPSFADLFLNFYENEFLDEPVKGQ